MVSFIFALTGTGFVHTYFSMSSAHGCAGLRVDLGLCYTFVLVFLSFWWVGDCSNYLHASWHGLHPHSLVVFCGMVAVVIIFALRGMNFILTFFYKKRPCMLRSPCLTGLWYVFFALDCWRQNTRHPTWPGQWGKESSMDRRYDTSAAVSELSTRVNLLRTVCGMWICGSKSSPALHAIVDNVTEAWDDRGSCVRSVGMHLRPVVGIDASM